MAGLGLLFSALSGGGKALAASAEQEQRVTDESRLMEKRAQLEEEKALRIAEATRVANRQASLTQGREISEAAGLLSGKRNQADADRINAENADVIGGSNMSAADAATLRNAPEAARKAYGLLSPSRQTDLEDRITASENLGYLDAARETRGALQTEVQNQRNKDVDDSTNRRLDQQEKRQETQDKFAQRREDRLDRLAQAQLGFQQARANKEDSRAEQMAEREQRAATVAAMKGAETDARQLQKELADPLMAEEQKKVIQRQLEVARADARRFRNALGGAGIDGGKDSSKASTDDVWAILTGGKGAGGAPAPAPGRAANPVAGEISEPVERRAPAAQANPRDMAKSGLDAAIAKTVRELTAAGNRGDKAEAARLNSLLQEQQHAKAGI